MGIAQFTIRKQANYTSCVYCSRRLKSGPWLLISLLCSATPALAQENTQTSSPALYLAQAPKLKALIPVQLTSDTIYPESEIAVLLKLVVSSTGSVDSVSVLRGAGDPFDEAVLIAARQFDFEPGRLNTGQTVSVTINYEYRILAPPPPKPKPEEAKPLTLIGTLLQRGKRKAIRFVEVQAIANGQVISSTTSDDQGGFVLVVPSTQFNLRIKNLFYEKLDMAIKGQAGETIEERYYLQAIGSRYETIVRARAIRREVISRKISKNEIMRAPGTAGDMLKAVANLPGVARSAFGGGPPILRGSAPGDSGIFLETQAIPQIYHFGGLRSTFNSAFLDEVNFVPGNFGPEFGRSIGGVIDVRVRDPVQDFLRGSIDINLYDASIVLEGPLTSSVAVGGAFRRSYIDSILPAVIPEDAPISFKTAPRFYDYQFIASWKLTKRQSLRFIAFGARDKLRLLFDDPQADPQVRGALQTNVSFHNFMTIYSHKISSRIRQTINLVVGLQDLRFELGENIKFALHSKRINLRNTWDIAVASWLGFRSGIDIEFAKIELDLNVPQPPKEGENPTPLSASETFSTEIDSKVFNPGAFAELSLTILDDLIIVPSLRADYYEAIDKYTFDPRLLAQYRVNKDLQIKAGFGAYQQQPEYDESSEVTGAPNLDAERSIQSSLGISGRLFDSLELELTGFYKVLDQQVVRNLEAFADPAQPQYTNQGTGRIYGFETLAKLRLGKEFFAWLAYTYQRSLRTDRPDEDERLFDFDQPHILTAVASYQFESDWVLGARFRVVSGNPTTSVVRSLFDSKTDVYIPVYGATHRERLGLFHQLDVRIDKTWTFDEWTLNTYLDIQNIYNQANPEGWRYNFNFSERQIISGLPILPIIGLKGEW